VSRFRAGTSLLAVAALTGVLAGCGSDADEVAALTTRVEQLNDEREGLQQEVDAAATRHDKTVAVVEWLRTILDDPESVGDEDAVTTALAELATPDAQMEDDALGGSIGMRLAWSKTLYSNAMDARIDIRHSWVSDDGTLSGGLWIRHGTNQAGNPFELIGVQVDTHDDEGLITHELVVYPYPDEYVVEAVQGAGTPVVLTAEE
jgi:outer membrane murein-binding lipoprotein Lpp